MPVHPPSDEGGPGHRGQPEPDDQGVAPPPDAAAEKKEGRHRQRKGEKTLEQPRHESPGGCGGGHVVAEDVRPGPEQRVAQDSLAPEENGDGAGDAHHAEADKNEIDDGAPKLPSPQPANQPVRRQRQQQEASHLLEQQRAGGQPACRQKGARSPAPPQMDEHRQRPRQHREELGVRRQQLGLVRRGEHGVEEGGQPPRAPRRHRVGAAPAGQGCRDGPGGERRREGGHRRDGVHRPHLVATEQPEDGGVEVEDRRELVLHAVAVGEPAGQHPAGDRRVRAFVDVHDRVDEARRAQQGGHDRHRQQTSEVALPIHLLHFLRRARRARRARCDGSGPGTVRSRFGGCHPKDLRSRS